MLHLISNEQLIRVILFFVLVHRDFECIGIEVNTSQGILNGVEWKLNDGKTVNAFLGVPYARPPVLEYRFKVSITD